MAPTTTSDDRSHVAAVVGVVSALGIASIALALALVPRLDPPLGAPSSASYLVVAAFALAAAASEIVRVPLLHGDAREDLTFFEIVTVAGILILAPSWAMMAPLFGLAVSQIALRKAAIKALFNVGSYAVATSLAVVAYLVVTGGAERFSARSIVALLVGMALFGVVNSVLLAEILHASLGVGRFEVLRDVWGVPVLMTFGSVGVAATAVAIAPVSPMLVPFTLLPALALWYAYRSTAQRLLERARNHGLIRLSGILAEESALSTLLSDAAGAIGSAFGASAVRIVMPDEASLLALPDLAADVATDLHAAELPQGWAHGSAIPLELGSSRRGALLLGSERGAVHAWNLKAQDVAMLTTVAASLASAVRSVEHRTALVEESSKLKAVVEHASDGIAVLTGIGDVRLWSPAMVRITGIREADVNAVGTDAPEALVALVEAAERTQPLAEGAARMEVTPVSLALHRPDGELRDVAVSIVRARPFGDGEQVAILTVHDVTAQARADRLKSDFVATISHELRTPITPIKGYAELLLSRGDSMTPERRRNAMELIAKGADHLSQLVEDLLMASRASGTLGSKLGVTPSEQDLRGVVSTAVSNFPDMAGRLNVEVPETPVPVFCDSVRAVQILTNLLSNAGKYSPADAPISLRIVPTEFGDSHVSVQVTDHGCGLAASELDHVFERFYRVEDSMTMQTSGSGLGLYIARELAAAMGGTLTATSQPGQGSTFTVSLPRNATFAPDSSHRHDLTGPNRTAQQYARSA